MDVKTVFLFILFEEIAANVVIFAAARDSESSRSAYFTTRENKRLEGHVVKLLESPSLMSCSQSCLRNVWCTSTNFKVSSVKNGKGTCELNKHGTIDENTKIHDQQGVTFSMLLKVIIYIIRWLSTSYSYPGNVSFVVCLKPSIVENVLFKSWFLHIQHI